MTIPYFYIIKDKIENKYYVGSRIAQGCHPNEFWKKGGYFTSSKLIHSLIKEAGKDRFGVITIIPREDAEIYETTFLTLVDARNNKNFYNQHNNIGGGFNNKFYISVKDKDGNFLRVQQNDKRIGKTLFGVNTGKVFEESVNMRKTPYESVMIDGVEYHTIKNASEKLGLSRTKILNYIKLGVFDKPYLIDYQAVGKKISETKNSDIWKNTVGKESSRKQVMNTDYKDVGNKISKTRLSEEWKSKNTFDCPKCGKIIVGKSNLLQHIRANKCNIQP